jgi:tRNA nucleotidyltransferase (CCA-adding enzyme)
MKVNFSIPSYVQKVARMLTNEGYQCYLVGGSLRDIILNINPEDYDMATDATPEQMLTIFPKSVLTGARFGMVTALVTDIDGETQEVQVTTFRSEEEYTDGRWPTKVNFIDDINRDLGRRDFTINAMALNLASAELDGNEAEKEWEIYDPFNGVKDLELKLIRAVGTPIERFKEDGLRGYRACRLASQLQFEIEPETLKAISEAVTISKLVSMERVRDEFMKLLMHSAKPSIGLELLRKTGLLELFLPELLEGYGVEQKLFHSDDVYSHILRTVDLATDRVKLAALFHDIAKPRTDMQNGHFYGHDAVGAEIAREVMERLHFSKSEIKKVVTLVKNHMFFFPYESENMREEDAQRVQQHVWTDAAVRRFIMRVGEENIDDLFALRIADASANPKSLFSPDEITQLQLRIAQVRMQDMALKITDLAINGNDLLELGLKGPEIGKTLDSLLERVVEDPLLNDKEKLKDLVREVT